MKVSATTLRALLMITITVLLSNALAVSRDYQDTWILEGLEISYAVFVVTYIAYFIVERRFNWLILFALISHITFLLLPNFKYTWFLGLATDQQRQYRLALDIYSTGHVSSGTLYSQTPFLALSIAIPSIVSGLPILHSMKYFPLMLWFTYPIWVYILMKKFDVDSSVLKYALLVSAVPVEPLTSYMVTGTLYGAFFVFLILAQFAKLAEKKDSRNWVIAIIFIFALVGGHTVSSLILSTILLIVSLLSLVLDRFSRDSSFALAKPSLLSAMTVIVIAIGWFSSVATLAFENAINFFRGHIYRILGVPISFVSRGFVPTRFFEIGIVDQLRVLLVFHGADLLLMFFTGVVVLIISRDYWLRKKRGLILCNFVVVAMWLLFLYGFLLNLGFNWYDRIFRYVLVTTPIFLGIALHRIETKLHSKVVSTLIISFLVVLATVELYRCQPLIPASSSLGNYLPSDEPIVYINEVNTAYQRYMVYHAEKYLPSNTRIAADRASRNQLLGLTSSNFTQDRRIFDALSRSVPVQPDYFLLHYPGISGKFLEQAENRTRSLISSIVYDSSYNIIYSNAESYILDRAR